MKQYPFNFGDRVNLRDRSGFSINTEFYIKSHPADWEILSTLGVSITVIARRNGVECEIKRKLEDLEILTREMYVKALPPKKL